MCLLLFATTLHNITHHTTLPPMWVRVVCVVCGVCSGCVCVLYTNTPVNAHTHNLQRHAYKHTPFYTNTDPQTQHNIEHKPPHHVVTVCDAKTRQLEHEKRQMTQRRQKIEDIDMDSRRKKQQYIYWNMQHKYTDRRDKGRTRERRTTTQQRTGNRGGDKEHSCACICVCFCVFNIVHQTTISNLS